MRSVSLGAMLLIAACGPPSREWRERVVPVTVIVVEPTVFSRTVMAAGWLEGGAEAVLYVPEPGRITGVRVSEGDSVEPGDTLVLISTDRAWTAGLTCAAAAVSAASAAEAAARENLERLELLTESGAASPREYEEALAQAREASAALASARAGYASARDGAARGVMLAPFRGTVTRVWARTGCPAAGPLAALAGEGTLKCRVGLSVGALPWIRPGLPAFFATEHRPGMLFPGWVVSAGDRVDPVTGLVSAVLQFPDSTGLLSPGMSGMASIALETVSDAVVLPENAFVIGPDGERTVMVVRRGRAVELTPDTGLECGFMVQVLDRVTPGDSVILLGNTLVSPGDSVAAVAR